MRTDYNELLDNLSYLKRQEIIKEISLLVSNVRGEVTETLTIAKNSDEQINKSMCEYEQIVKTSENLISEIYKVGNEIKKVN